MFSRGTKTDNGKNAAYGRSVQLASHCQHEIGGEQPVDPHIEHSAGSALISQIIGSADAVGFDNSLVGFPYALSPHRNPAYNHASKQHGQHDSKYLIVPCGPDKPGFYLHPKGFKHRHDDRGYDAGGKSHIVQGVSFVGKMHMGGKGRKHKAYNQPHGQGNGHPHHHRQVAHLHHLGNDWRQAGAVQANVNIPAHGCLVVPGVQVHTGQNGPYVKQVLAEQREPEHQAAGCDGVAVHVHAHEVDNANAHKCQGAGIDEGSPHAAHNKIIRYQEIRFFYQAHDSRADFLDWLQKQPNDHKINREQRQQKKLLLPGQGFQFMELLQMFHKYLPIHILFLS